jgi:NMD protein affecting ribosome stability and mRNA decay
MNKLKKLLMRYIPDCNESTEVLWWELHEKPKLRQRIGMRLHIMACKSCRDYRKDLQWVNKTLEKSKGRCPLSTQYKMLPETRESLQKITEDENTNH